MKKLIIGIFVLVVLFGCGTSASNDRVYMEKYETYYQAILDNADFYNKSKYFNIEVVLNIIDEGYRYDVILDNPQVAMYNIEALAIVDDGSVSIDQTVAMPSSGIFDEPYHLIPYQVNVSGRYVKGIVLDGVITSAKALIKVIVIWQNEAKTKSYKEFFSINVEYGKK